MKFLFITSLVSSFFFLTPNIAPVLTMEHEKDRTNSNINPSTDDIDSISICVLQGWMNTLRKLQDDNCLPRDHANEFELNSGEFEADYLVPNMIGYWMLIAVLSYEVKLDHPNLTNGFDQAELLDKLHCIVDKLDNIIEEHAYVDSTILGSGKKALYQIHKISGEAPKMNSFEETVSMLDNVYLVTSLCAVMNWAQDIDPTLTNKISSTLTNFDIGMWFKNGNWYLGGPEDPRGGPKVDRITSESRLIHTLAFAQNDIDLGQFICGINRCRSLSVSYISPTTVGVQYLPNFGRALEKWVATSFLPIELKSQYGENTLYPLLEVQEEFKCSLNLVSNDLTPIGNGYGDFSEFGISPSENTSLLHNSNLLIPPAVMMQAGVMAKSHPLADCNFRECIKLLHNAGQLQTEWGPANYFIDSGSSLVNMDTLFYGTLEIEQGALSLLNMILGGDFIQNLLELDSSWGKSISHYESVLNDRLVLVEGEDLIAGNGDIKPRSNACSSGTYALKNPFDSAIYALYIEKPGNYKFSIRSSNDNSGISDGDYLDLFVDSELKGLIHAEDTGDFGLGWNVFSVSNEINIGYLDTGTHYFKLSINPNSDLVEIDAIMLEGDFEYKSEYQPEIVDCCSTPTGVVGELKHKFQINTHPNPATSEVNVSFYLHQSQKISVRLLNSSGETLRFVKTGLFHYGNNTINIQLGNIPSGIYFIYLYGANISATSTCIKIE